MTSIDTFGQFRSFSIGFDKLFSDMERISNHSTNFVTYNVIKSSDDSYLIELAVARTSIKKSYTSSSKTQFLQSQVITLLDKN